MQTSIGSLICAVLVWGSELFAGTADNCVEGTRKKEPGSATEKPAAQQ